jgi:hypothetical protein
MNADVVGVEVRPPCSRAEPGLRSGEARGRGRLGTILLQIDGLVAAGLVELGAPYLV